MKVVSKLNLASLLVLLVSNSVLASTVRVDFDFTVTTSIDSDRNIGNNLSGYLVYDLATPISSFPSGSPPYTTNYSGVATEFIVDGLKVDTVTFNILSETDYDNSDRFVATFSVGGFDSSTGLRESLDLTFDGDNILNSIYEVIDNPVLANMDFSEVRYTRQQTGVGGFIDERFYGELDTLSVTAVPVPAGWFLFLSGMVFLFKGKKQS